MGRDDCRERRRRRCESRSRSRSRDCKYRKKCKCKRKCKRKCPPVTLKILTDLPTTLELTRVWEEFAEKLRVNSLGTIEVELMRSTDVDIPGAEIQDRIANDTIPVGPNELVAGAVFTFGQNWNGQIEEFSSFYTGQFPFGMEYEEYMTWFNNGGGREVQQQVYDNVYGEGVIYSEVFGAGGGAEAAGFFPTSFAEAQTVQEIDDLALTFRIQGLGKLVLETALPQWTVVLGIPGLSPLEALCVGELDGFEFSDANTNNSLVFPDLATNPVACGAPMYYLAGWHGPTTVFRYIMNDKYHKKLSPFQKRVLEQTLRQCTDDSYRTQLGEGAIAIRDRKEEPFYAAGLCLRTRFLPELVDALQAAEQNVLEAQALANPNFALLLESYKGYMENTQAWILNNTYNDTDRFEEAFPNYTPVTPVDNCP